MRVYDYQCSKGHVTEAFVSSADDDVSCPVCGGPTRRDVPAPRAVLDGISGHFPGAAAAWENKRNQRMKQERKHEANHGTTRIGKNAA